MHSFTQIPAPPSDFHQLDSWLAGFTNWEKQAPLSTNRRALGPARCRSLLERADLLSDLGPTIQVAGTKGKGSTVLWLEALLRHREYPTAATLSPHLVSLEERIRIDGIELPGPSLMEGLENLYPHLNAPTQDQDHSPTFFDLWIALFIERARNAGDRWLLLEVGMGGPLDSTSAIEHDVGILTTVDLDHRPFLGDSMKEITHEKSKIARRGKPFIIAAGDYACEAEEIAISRGAHPLIVQDDVRIPRDFQFPQRLNGACALAALESLPGIQPWKAEEVQLVAKQLQLPARLEELPGPDQPLLLDGAHTPLSLAAFTARFESYCGGRTGALLIGMLADKEIELSLAALTELDPKPQIVTVTPSSPRSLPARELAKIFSELGLEATPIDEMGGAIRWLKERAATGCPVAATGSMHLAGEVRSRWLAD